MIMEINLAYYNQKDWKRFLELIDDRDSMFDTWEDWYKTYKKTKKKLITHGYKVNDIIIDIDELIMYCKLSGLKNNGTTRSKFVSEKY